jgi:hypothetical protein
MTSILKRAALAAALTTAAAATVLTSAGSAQAHYVGMGKGDLKGLAAVQLDKDEWIWWTTVQDIVCAQIKDEVNGARSDLGLGPGISSVEECAPAG